MLERLERLERLRLAATFGVAVLASASLGAQAYDPVGPQTAVALSTVEAGGWEHCFSTSYARPMWHYMPTIQAGCTGESLLLACSPVSAATLSLLAQGPRDEVLADPGDGMGDSHLVNGAQWYFSFGGEGDGAYSWGFAGEGASVSRYPCDTVSDGAQYRLCWHLLENEGGYRCGETLELNASTEWTKHVYRYTSALFADGFEAAGDVCAWSSSAGAAGDCSQTLTLELDPACGTTYVDQGVYDLDPDPYEVGFRFDWNDLQRDRGYRLQLHYGTSFEGESEYAELPSGTSQSPIFRCYESSCSWTYRILAHVGHSPGHGSEPIAGDVVSNACTIHTAIE